jgi:hypothetical protein
MGRPTSKVSKVESVVRVIPAQQCLDADDRAVD